MYALTLWQPWAWAVAHAGKDVENRSWQPPAAVIGRQIAIHAGVQWDQAGWERLLHQGLVPPPYVTAPPRGESGIVALATVARVVTASDSPWFVGPYGWLLKQVMPLDPVVPVSGAQGLWRVPQEVAREVYHRLGRPAPAQQELTQ